MGELESVDSQATHRVDAEPAAHRALLLAPPDPAASRAMDRAAARRRRRRRVSREALLRAVPERSDRARYALGDLWDGGREESMRRAARYRSIVASAQDPLGPEFEVELGRAESLQVAMALRCTRAQADREIREAHRVCELLPASLERLETGDLPWAWFEKLLRRTATLEDPAVAEVDRGLGTMELDVTPEAFSRRVNYLVTRAVTRHERAAHSRPEARRRVVLDEPRADGTGCLRIIGPIPELLVLSRRLDAAAHAVKNAQLKALEEGTEIPCDAGGRIEQTAQVPTIAEIRYELLHGASLDTGAVDVAPERFRMTVTVPVMSLLGESDAPGMLDGVIPIPASMACDLAAGEKTWHRVLTDPGSGRFLPLPADRYTPTTAMVEHLRLRHPTCAVPGCGRPSSFLSETDHLEEFDAEDPGTGGATEIENLSRLCREHHRMKTAGMLHPLREPGAGRTWWEVTEQVIAWQEDGRNLATEQVTREMLDAWESYQARETMRGENARRLRGTVRRMVHGEGRNRDPDDGKGGSGGADGGPLPLDEPPPF